MDQENAAEAGDHAIAPLRLLERFFGILTENYAGAFGDAVDGATPVRLLKASDAVTPYVEDSARLMREAGTRVDITTNERLAKLGCRREAGKVPVMCVVGEQEAADGRGPSRYADGDQARALGRDDGQRGPPRQRGVSKKERAETFKNISG